MKIGEQHRAKDGIYKMFKSDLTTKELQCIKDYIEKLNNPIYIEVGVFECGTFLEILKQKKISEAIGIDLFEDFKKSDNNTHTDYTVNRNELISNIREKEKSSGFIFPLYELIKGDSSEILSYLILRKDKDFVIFIDGNHTYEATKKDFEAIINKIKNGYVIFHNATNTEYPDYLYVEKDGGVWKLVEELKSKYTFMGYQDRCAIFKIESKDNKNE